MSVGSGQLWPFSANARRPENAVIRWNLVSAVKIYGCSPAQGRYWRKCMTDCALTI